MGAVICMGCRSPLDGCDCAELEEAEVAEGYLDGQCHVCNQLVTDLYPQLAEDYRTLYVCEECLDWPYQPPCM